MTTIYRAAILHSTAPDEVEFFASGDLEVATDGTITAVGASADGESPPKGSSARLVELPGRLIIPGLIDAHVHIPQIDVIGVSSENLLNWLDRHVFPAEIACRDPEVARDRARRSFHRMLAAGTTACAAFSSSHTHATEIAFEEAEACGIRAIIGKVLMDREAPEELCQPASTALAETADLITRWSGAGDGRLDVAVTPRFAISCSPALLRGAGELARSTGAPVQTHLAETKAEGASVAALFPNCADYTAVYERFGLVGERTLLAHCIHLSDDELTRLAAAGATAVHCPDSNFFLHSGRFPLARARAAKLPIAVGSDVGAGTSYSIFEAMRLANYMQIKTTDPIWLFYAATLGGAQALGWGHLVGNFAVGKAADFAVVAADDLLAHTDVADIRTLVSKLMHMGSQLPVEAVYTDGHLRLERGDDATRRKA